MRRRPSGSAIAKASSAGSIGARNTWTSKQWTTKTSAQSRCQIRSRMPKSKL